MAGGFHSLSAAFGQQAVRARLAQGLAHGVQADHGFSRHGRARRGLERVAVNQLEFQGVLLEPDPSLNKYINKVLFPKKLDLANKALSLSGAPKI